jgi:putative aldouronate transport system permease protein
VAHKASKKIISFKDICIHLFFILVCLSFIVPLILIVSISFSSEESVTAFNSGYSLIPKEYSLNAYKQAFRSPEKIIRGYYITIAQAFLGTFLSCLLCGMIAYPLSRRNFAYKSPITFIVFFTMLFSGGMIPTYIVYTRWYGLGDSFWVYILPGLAGGAWNTLMVRTFFKGLPESLFESVKVDGGRELTIFFKIALPLSKPVFATIGFMMLVGKWNDWNTSLLYIRKEELYTLQYILQKVLNEAQFVKSISEYQVGRIDSTMFKPPTETLKYALCVIAAGPMLIIFPFFQKYFSKGMTIGALKGLPLAILFFYLT